MTHGEWIARREPGAPERLVARVHEVLGAHAEWERLPVADALVRAGESLLERVVTGGAAAGREIALDLLAADACVTWAFEAAADEPETIGARARDAARRIAGVAS